MNLLAYEYEQGTLWLFISIARRAKFSIFWFIEYSIYGDWEGSLTCCHVTAFLDIDWW